MLLRKPIFWISACLLFVGGMFYSAKVFPKAFTILNVELKMNRDNAFSKAKSLSESNKWGPENYNQAATFYHDSQTQNFVELDVGGSEKVSNLMKDGLYHFYTWKVRHYKELEANETIITFTPSGNLDIGLPYFLYISLYILINSAGDIGLIFLTSLTLSIK